MLMLRSISLLGYSVGQRITSGYFLSSVGWFWYASGTSIISVWFASTPVRTQYSAMWSRLAESDSAWLQMGKNSSSRWFQTG